MIEQVEDYCIVSHSNIKMLEAEVKKMIAEGWCPHGSLTSVVSNMPNALAVVCQSMVKVKPSKPEAAPAPVAQPMRHKHSLYKNLE